ncbi:hypothetical protein [Clostridium celatum]|uniref:Uncharacterized protein n=1 Tax=Clostridium celatum DSM 1785 TaxID=545697 RepID=L1QM20_9CLOT|nr:hypothetical protein [Clostridium celatum]EKY28617.1 hypothetical protein HMPREF0216_00670 [Clostridium celatum DSM 1785]MCE9654917.1 hypothetical protein [Clostridium celatum]MDU2265349.1 hypothetical protein [Clostridium celatum]MDU6294981.1 hypothetical protein [Clostridium celatum]MDY3360326.1 hypothetical protein [Clostridium celatum]
MSKEKLTKGKTSIISNQKGFKMPVGDMRKTKTDYDIPTFGFKSALLIVGAAIVSTIVIPMLLQFTGLNFEVVAIIANTLITSYAVAYSRYFIESKKGYCKKFWYTYLIFAVSFCVIGFLWLIMSVYV